MNQSILLLTLFVMGTVTPSYLEFKLIEIPPQKRKFDLDPVLCKDETKINSQAQYRQVCYEKDNAYGIVFRKDQVPYFMSIDFTAPISWLKDQSCKIQGTNQKCKFVKDGFVQRLHRAQQKVKNVFKKIHLPFTRKGIPTNNEPAKHTATTQNSIIEGSSEVIRGEVQKHNLQFIVTDSNRLNSFYELMMLGLFVFGEKDHLILQNSNFVSAMRITPNLNNLMDGAISMRFDESSENSFLNEIFTYAKTNDKMVTVFLGYNHSITIGDKTAKYSEEGYSGINWIDLPDNQGTGKLPQITDMAIEDQIEDSEQDQKQTLPAVFTLSASYIGLPQALINLLIIKDFQKFAKCEINNQTGYVHCTATNKKMAKKVMEKNLIFGFSGVHLMIKMQDLALKGKSSNSVIFNIKKTQSAHAILGEPAFMQYYVLFDFAQNKIGIATKREETLEQQFISVVSLVRMLVWIFVLGCTFIICYQPCRKLFTAFAKKQIGRGGQSRRLRQYAPIQQNPYDDLQGKIKEAIGSQERQEQK